MPKLPTMNELSFTESKTSSHDRIVWRVEQMMEREYFIHLELVEKSFIKQMHDMINSPRSHYITEKQKRWVIKIWFDLHVSGKVPLPPGKI